METSLLNVVLEATKFFGIRLFDPDDFFELLWRFILNALVAILITRYIYYPSHKRRDFVFTFLLFSVVVFFLCHLLSNVKISMGFALGLFAIFGIMRYRTDTVAIREMTYLFVIIGISVINALANKKVSYAELFFTNFVIIAFVYAFEKMKLLKHESSKIIRMEKIELIKPGNEELLLSDIRERTGLNIHRYEIIRVDFLRDLADLTVYYYEGITKVNNPKN